MAESQWQSGGGWTSGSPAMTPRVWAETFHKPDFVRIKELKALINGIFMKEGEVNIWLGRASKCINNCSDDSQRSHGSLSQLIDYWRQVIGWNPLWRKYRELVNCLDSSFFSSKWKRTHLSSLTPRLPGSAELKLNVSLDKVPHNSPSCFLSLVSGHNWQNRRVFLFWKKMDMHIAKDA